MNKHTILGWLISATFVALVVVPASDALSQGKGKGGSGASNYKIVELIHRPGLAYGINDLGECVGEITDVDELAKPYFWLVNDSGKVVTTPLSLETVQGEPVLLAGSAQDINENGLIVGYGKETSVQTHAVYWPNALAGPVFLPTPVDTLRSAAYAVNKNGVIVGYYLDSAGLQHPVAWGVRINGTIVGPVEMQADTVAQGIAEDVNDSQIAVGWQNVGSSAEAWMWQLDWDGTTLTFEAGSSLEPCFPAASYVDSFAQSVNNDGAICGMRNPGGRAEAWFLKPENGSLSDQSLTLLIDNSRTGSANNYARALNNLRPPQVVGEASTYSKKTGATRGLIAVLWQNESIIDLRQSASSPTLTASPLMWGINDSGWIVGEAWTGETAIPGVPCVIIPKP